MQGTAMAAGVAMGSMKNEDVHVYGVVIDGSRDRGDRFRDDTLENSERHFSLWMHLSMLLLLLPGIGLAVLIVPVVLWVMQKDKSPFNDDHGRQVINFMISVVLLHALLLVTVIGVVLWPVLWIVSLVNVIRAASAAHRGEYFRYPLTFRFLS